MKIKLIDVCYQDATGLSDTDADFYLEMDDWNDYGYYTTYHLHATKQLTKTKTAYLGSINILKKGQSESESRLLAKEIKAGNLTNPFEKLPNDYCAISFSLELYLGLYKYLTSRQRDSFIRDMRMILSADEYRYRNFRDEPGFYISLLRNASMDSFVLKKGRSLVQSSGTYHDWEHEKLTVNLKYIHQKIDLDFSGVKQADDCDYLPSGVIAFIGHNGCGKSTALYQLAKVLFEAPNEREKLKDVSVEPNDVGINKLLMFSYSAFDNFVMPGGTFPDLRLILEGMQDNSGRFVFCGLRDVKKEVEDKISEYLKQKKEGRHEDVFNNGLRVDDIKLKTIDELACEFSRALTLVIGDTEKYEILEQIIGDSKIVLPSLYVSIQWVNRLLLETEMLEYYKCLSTGVKFFLHALVHLIAYAEDNSIILFDEPENHLHPPFLSFMMSEFRKIIHRRHSVMLVSTHSPVILQETFSKNVYIMDRRNGETTIQHPKSEVYGESFGLINSMVFNLTSDITHYHDVVSELYDRWHCNELKTIREVLTRFKNRLGCKELSFSMSAYLVSLFEDEEE